MASPKRGEIWWVDLEPVAPAGRVAGFSMERFIRFLNSFGRDVSIIVAPKPKARERATVRVVGTAPAAERQHARDTLVGGI